ncbi:DUF3775 domain-containing protein [Microbulbifer yueqingensis]|uniref:DUF3775 domain-containing protein n=1 Tax=Microbulbifer yueqingensis TaxID=658219 RepID=A0A1G9CKN8_9GAMM|nr:DUF3775 domain-containing protein [Microbulbifer yueqingensis]SDK52044.1 Protein of unknown function [Microbulbifer yueqingensis]
MLTLNVETTCRLIDLAKEFHAQEGVSFPDEPDNASGDWARQIVASHGGDKTFQEFKSIVEDLEPDQQQELVALLWLGREDYSLGEWQDALAQAADDWTPETAEYLVGHPLLANYLEKGLEQFGHRCNE